MSELDEYIQNSVDQCDVCSDCRAYVYNEEYANFLVKYDFNLDIALERFEPDCVRVLTSQYAVVYKRITSRLSMGRLGYNSFPKCYGLMDSTSINATNVNRIRQVPGLGLTGTGTIFGIIDTGIDYTNPLFRNADGTTRIIRIWDQSEQGPEDTPSDDSPIFISGAAIYNDITGYGVIYSKEQIDEALRSENGASLVPENDTVGHGTFLASIAAGGVDRENDFTGMAPDSLIAVVKLKNAKQNIRDFYGINEAAQCYQEDDIMSAINFMLQLAQQERRPLVILTGIGTSQGDHNGNSYLEQYIERLSNFPGIIFANAAGNELITGGHYASNENAVNSDEAETNTDFVELSVGRGEDDFTLEIWGQSPGILSIGIESPTGQIETNIDDNSLSNPDGQEVRFLYEDTSVIVENILIEESSGDQVIVLRFRNPQDGIWRIRVDRDPEIISEYNMWLPIRAFLTADTRFLTPAQNLTLCSPANGALSITASGYNHVTGAIYVNSSRGYTRNNRRKPDVAAPSVNVFGAGRFGNFVTMSGTSVGAAHLTGAILLILEWAIVKGNYIEMNSRIVRQLIIRGARRNPDEVYPNRITGWGYLDVQGVFDSLRR